MKKFGLLALLSILATLIFADNYYLFIHKATGVSTIAVSSIDSMKFSSDKNYILISKNNGKTITDTISKIDSITFGDINNKVISIVYNGTSATVTNPYAGHGVDITTSGGDVTVKSTLSETEVTYLLSGTATDGSFKIYSNYKYGLTLNGVSLTNSDGPAINIQSGKKCTLTLTDGTTNTLTDGSSYTKSKEDQKGTLFSEGQIIFAGSGTLNVAGNYKHAICSDDYISVTSGVIHVTGAVSDAIHVNDYYIQSGGTVTLLSTGDGIDSEGYVDISGGTLTIISTSADVKGIKTGGNLDISGGTINLTVSGAQAKGFKSTGTTTLSGGAITMDTKGDAVLESSGSGYDPSYCTGIHSDSHVLINGSTINITSTGKAGKGISCDSTFTMTSGSVTISTSGAGATYTNTEGITDSYSATCISVDGATYLYGGTLNLTSTGSAGKAISGDDKLIIGESASTTGPTLTAKTTGAKFLVSGSGNNADYANPKAIKSDANITVNSGTLTITTTQDGGEGLESKDTLTINGGTLDIQAYDDCINSSNHIAINGGNIFCYSSGNDGIDSNGTLTVTGGIIISSGTQVPEEGFDCDQNTFKITGGVLIGTGGASSTPTASVSTQRSIVYNSSGTADQIIRIETSAGTELLTYKTPRTYSTMTLLFSNSALSNGTSYNIYKGGSVSGGTNFHGYYSGATYTKPSSVTNSFTISSMVTTVGNSTGGGGGGGGGAPGGR